VRLLVVLAAALAVLGAVALDPLGMRSRSPDAPRPDIVVFMIDTLRPGYLGIFGHDPDPAPFLGWLAERGTLFQRAFSTSSWTAPSVASLFTSLYPHEHGVTQGFWAHKASMRKLAEPGRAVIELNRIPELVPTLPEILKQAGYSTFGISTNRNVAEEMGFTRGFDHFRLLPGNADEVLEVVAEWRAALERETPHLLYVHLMDPHWKYEKRSPWYERYREQIGERERAAYLSEIRYTDLHIERMFELLDLRQGSLVVVLSDHGEEFRDHGSLRHPPTLYQELNHVLVLLYGPDLGVPSQRLRANVSLIDLLPTLIDVGRVELPAPGRGVSIWPLVSGREAAAAETLRTLERRTLLAHRAHAKAPHPEHWAAIEGAWKYIEHHGRPPELYDHEEDWSEQRNLARRRPAVTRRLQERLRSAREEPRRRGARVGVPLERELRNRLEALGYAD